MFKKVSVLIVLCAFIAGAAGILPLWAAEKVDVRKTAEDLAQFLISTRRIVAQLVDVINTHGAKVEEPLPKDAPSSFKGIIPAYMGRKIGADFFEKTGIRMKQTTLGKEEYGPRNSYNAADDWEKEVLTRFYEPSYPKGKGYGEEIELEGKHVYRYMLPLYIEKSCMKCHGDPATSPTGDGKDIAGKPMENYKEGEVRGAVSIIIPLEERLATSS
jgi:methyl-accepting chemotaxis protein